LASITVNGSLSGRLDEALDRFAGVIVLSYGSILTAGGEDFLYTSLRGRGLFIPASGPEALTGTISELTLDRTSFDGGSLKITTELSIKGFSVASTALFDLVGRIPQGVRVTFEEATLLRAMNAQSWSITGGAGGDSIGPGGALSLRGNDWISGQAGADRLAGGAGADRLLGGFGVDILWGGDGADRLTGGPGADRLTGGAGADVFAFATGFGTDVITDFRDGIDRIDLSGPRVVRDAGADTVVQAGADSIRLVGVDRADISWADFI
jgi:hypothetical protein